MTDTARSPGAIRRFVILWALSPFGLAIVMFFVTPTYFRPMLGSVVGLILLFVAANLTGLGVFLGLAAVSTVERRKTRLGGALLILQVLFCWLPALAIVLLGPAALILMHPRT